MEGLIDLDVWLFAVNNPNVITSRCGNLISRTRFYGSLDKGNSATRANRIGATDLHWTCCFSADGCTCICNIVNVAMGGVYEEKGPEGGRGRQRR
jgi:hypothetical protein